MILARIKRGAARASVLAGLKLESIARRPLRFAINLVKNAAIYALVLPLVTLPIPAHAATAASAVTDESDPLSSVPLVKVGAIKVEITFNPIETPQTSASPFLTPENTLSQVSVGKSHATEDAEHQAQLAAEAQAAAIKAVEQARLRQQQVEAAAAQALLAAQESSDQVENIAYVMTVGRYGTAQWSAMNALIMRESAYNPLARNGRSGACGIPQANPCNKLAQGINTSVEGQISWMLDYIANRYGTPDNALAYWDAHGSY